MRANFSEILTDIHTIFIDTFNQLLLHSNWLIQKSGEQEYFRPSFSDENLSVFFLVWNCRFKFLLLLLSDGKLRQIQIKFTYIILFNVCFCFLFFVALKLNNNDVLKYVYIYIPFWHKRLLQTDTFLH